MIDMTWVQIRRVNSENITYGPPVPHEDLPYAVLEAVECEVLETDQDEGRVSVGGQNYRWKRV